MSLKFLNKKKLVSLFLIMFFNLTLNAMADFNGDGKIDGFDFAIQASFDPTILGINPSSESTYSGEDCDCCNDWCCKHDIITEECSVDGVNVKVKRDYPCQAICCCCCCNVFEESVFLIFPEHYSRESILTFLKTHELKSVVSITLPCYLKNNLLDPIIDYIFDCLDKNKIKLKHLDLNYCFLSKECEIKLQKYIKKYNLDVFVAKKRFVCENFKDFPAPSLEKVFIQPVNCATTTIDPEGKIQTSIN